MAGILDTVSSSQQTEALRNFNPQGQILDYLRELGQRESQILINRYGLRDGLPQTLEQIGKELHLTRERVRQVEKNALKKLAGKRLPAELQTNADFIFQLIEDRGNIIRETALQNLLTQDGVGAKNCLLFILRIVPRFNYMKETEGAHACWYLSGFDRETFEELVGVSKQILEESKKALKPEVLFEKIRTNGSPEIKNLSDAAIESMITATKLIDRNPFGEWGLSNWSEINPSDVGDKAFLVLEHHEKPEHYAAITELINRQLSPDRAAHKETVHNELIKDDRFVLVGRGIYALTKWGYKKGVVADVIDSVIRKLGHPLTKEEIIAEVMKQRIVKRNTIIVGLSNRSRFAKTSDNKYTTAGNV